jgi:SCP1.201-like deaminase
VGSPLSDILAALDAVQRSADEAAAAVARAITVIDQVTVAYRTVLAGAWDVDAGLTLEHARLAQRRGQQATVLISAAQEHLTAYQGRVRGAGPVSSGFDSTHDARPTVAAEDGSIYPSDMAGDLPDLPPRVRARSRGRTVGVAYLAGRRIGVVVSGNRDPRTGDADPYAALARARLRSCGLDDWNGHHVEAKLVARMLESRVPEGEVNLNNVPCGWEAAIQGCHQILPDMLPQGTILRVRGTYSDGTRAFDRIYQGRGPAW